MNAWDFFDFFFTTSWELRAEILHAFKSSGTISCTKKGNVQILAIYAFYNFLERELGAENWVFFFNIWTYDFLQKSMQIEDKNKQIAKIILRYEQKSSFYTLILDY